MDVPFSNIHELIVQQHLGTWILLLRELSVPKRTNITILRWPHTVNGVGSNHLKIPWSWMIGAHEGALFWLLYRCWGIWGPICHWNTLNNNRNLLVCKGTGINPCKGMLMLCGWRWQLQFSVGYPSCHVVHSHGNCACVKGNQTFPILSVSNALTIIVLLLISAGGHQFLCQVTSGKITKYIMIWSRLKTGHPQKSHASSNVFLLKLPRFGAIPHCQQTQISYVDDSSYTFH